VISKTKHSNDSEAPHTSRDALHGGLLRGSRNGIHTLGSNDIRHAARHGVRRATHVVLDRRGVIIVVVLIVVSLRKAGAANDPKQTSRKGMPPVLANVSPR
jgi:hypothetical protein